MTEGMSTPRVSRCPTCAGPVLLAVGAPRPKHYPFCCVRCQLADLGKWLDEEYRVTEPVDQAGGGVDAVAPDSE